MKFLRDMDLESFAFRAWFIVWGIVAVAGMGIATWVIIAVSGVSGLICAVLSTSAIIAALGWMKSQR